MSLSVAEVCYFQERFGNAVISIDDLIIGEPVGEGEGNKHYNYSLYVKKTTAAQSTGSFGKVHRGTLKSDSKDVAIKSAKSEQA